MEQRLCSWCGKPIKDGERTISAAHQGCYQKAYRLGRHHELPKGTPGPKPWSGLGRPGYDRR